MGAESQPFMYDHPSKYSFVGPSEKGFNPRAASEASWRASVPRPKVEGPLIQSKEMNRHPDSYFVVPYGNLNWKPMSPRTKDKVKWVRLTQLLIRVLSLLGAGGMLFCVICIKNTDSTTGWVIRVPAAVAILHTVYAVYHLARSSRGRTPASSASYMLFAAFVDASLIPFYVFATLMAREEYTEPAGNPDRWQTLFNDDIITYKIVYSTFLISIACGGLHLVSCILSLYLGVLFRKISRLPPDMNPLEDNLTSRHKRNKSSLLDNRMSQTSTANSTSTLENKVDDPLISPVRTVPFMHTRNDSQSNLSDVPHPNFSPRASRSDFLAPSDDQLSPNRNSRSEMSPRHGHSPSQASSNISSRTHFPNLMLQSQQPTIPNVSPQPQPPPKSPLRQQPPQPQFQGIHRSPTKSSSIYSTDTTTATNTTFNARPPSTVPSLLDSNWITHPSPSPSPPRELKHLTQKKTSYQPLSRTSPFEYTATANIENQPPPLLSQILRNPLEMNPPTPPLPMEQRSKKQSVQNNTQQRALHHVNGNSRQQYSQPQQQSSWYQGPGIMGIGKARAWGGMTSQPAGRPLTAAAGNTGNAGGNGSHRNGGNGGGGGRVVSRSGVEVRGQGVFLPSGGVRAREVSGKVVEEGRGGGGSNWDLVRE